MSGDSRLLRGSKEIAEAVGLSQKQINYYILEMDLPCFKITLSKKWLVFEDGLIEWARVQRDRYQKR